MKNEESRPEKMNKKRFIAVIHQNFLPGVEFSAEDIQSFVAITKGNAIYYLGEFSKKGELMKTKPGRWIIPVVENAQLNEPSDVSEIKPEPSVNSTNKFLKVSLEEKKILQAIFDMDLKSKGGISRFGLDHLKEKLTEVQLSLLTELFPKLKNLGIVTCQGHGAREERIMEIHDELFLKYMSEEYLEIVPFSNTELDSRVNKIIMESKKLNRAAEKFNSLLSLSEQDLIVVLKDIENLEKKKNELQEKIETLKLKLSNTSQTGFDDEFIDYLEKMSLEKRRAIFQRVLGDT